MHIKQTHISNTQPNLHKEHVSPTHGLTDGIKHENTTSCIKHWGIKWLNQTFCAASAYVSADRNEARNPQRFKHATVNGKRNRTTTKTI